MTEELCFGYHNINKVPVNSPYRKKRPVYDFDKVALSRELYRSFSKRLDDSGLFANATFSRVDVFFYEIALDCRKKPLKFVEKRKDKSLWITSEHYHHELANETESSLKAFLTSVIETALHYAFQKYGNGSNPFVRHESVALNQPVLVNVDLNTEVIVYLKHSDAVKGMDAAMANIDLIEELDRQLRDANIGRMDGAEFEDGFEKVFLVGLHADRLSEACVAFLKDRKVEAGSYVVSEESGQKIML